MASIDKRPNGAYLARWREYPGGPQRYKQFGRKLDAERHLVEVQHAQLSGTYVSPEDARVTLADWSEQHIARQSWRPKTEKAARTSLRHALAVLGDRPLNTIKRGDVQSLFAGLDLAPGSVGLVRQYLTAVLQSAVDDGMLARNPARGVRVAQGQAAEVLIPTTEQVQALVEAAPAWFRAAVVLGAGLGLRQAEASGLTVDRIRWLPDRTVRVDRQWESTVRPYRLAPVKSAASVRSVPAAEAVLAELATHVGRRHDGFVLSVAGDGFEAADHNRISKAWRKTTAAVAIEGMRFHHLRHYFASSLISAGCSIKAVQTSLGHASAAVTLDVYGHLFPGDEDRIRAAVERAFSAELGPAEYQVSNGQPT